MKKLLVILFFLCACVWGYGAEYYVSKSGNDSNPGYAGQPWLTIKRAADGLVAGDTVYIQAGTYNERVIPKNSGQAGKYITYTAYPGDTVTIDGSGINMPDDLVGLFDINGRSYIAVSGLRVINAGPNQNNAGIMVNQCSYVTIKDNYTYNTVSSGIGVWESSNIIIDNNEVELACNDGEQECLTVAVTDTFEIKNNHVHHGGPGNNGAEGLDGKDGSSNGKIYNNIVHDMNRLGIYVDAWDKHTYNIEIYNNLVYNCVGDGITLASEMGGLLENIDIFNNVVYGVTENGFAITRNGPPGAHPMKDITCINNTFYNNGSSNWGGGIMVDNPGLQSLIIRNNILSQNVYYSMEVEADVTMGNLTIDNNLIHGFRNYQDEVKGSNYVEADPLFVNASGADFHLLSGSPAIDQGSASSAPGFDYDNKSRPSGSGIDIGAFEYGSSSGTGPQISLSPTTINVTVYTGVNTPTAAVLNISNSGTGTLNWSLTKDSTWITCSPTSGSGDSTVNVAIYTPGLMVGSYSGSITVSDSNAINSPQTVTVNLTVISSGSDSEPFGQFDSPINGATVRSSVAVTGWALDDVSISSVKIYRDPVPGEGGSLIFIGDTNFVEGARPDVAAAYPGYPNNTKAGWGYMLLTNFLPAGGNGTYTLYAVAEDSAGQPVTLGSKIITCDNANAVKPFGAIDTPTQGGTASGSSFVNWGWVLTPQPNSIPIDGSTIDVWVDGLKLGQPTYNLYRSDIAALFPTYANSNGAVGYFYLDTLAIGDGVHTIQWTATDNALNTDGIGSRYFTINNQQANKPAFTSMLLDPPCTSRLLDPHYKAWESNGNSNFNSSPSQHGNREPQHGAVDVLTGFSTRDVPRPVKPGANGVITVNLNELDRFEMHFFPGGGEVGEIQSLTPLPIGSTLDVKRGIFYWQPGLAFMGPFQFEFLVKERDGRISKRKLLVIIQTGNN
jgi:Right handed beta helix region/Bacterial Ig domain/Viral BACON domain